MRNTKKNRDYFVEKDVKFLTKITPYEKIDNCRFRIIPCLLQKNEEL